MARWARDAAGCIGSLGARKANGSTSFYCVGHVDAIDPGTIRVVESQPLHARSVVWYHSILRPSLLLECPIEGIRPVLRDRIGEVLLWDSTAPRLNHRNALGRRTLCVPIDLQSNVKGKTLFFTFCYLHENKLTVSFAVELESE